MKSFKNFVKSLPKNEIPHRIVDLAEDMKFDPSFPKKPKHWSDVKHYLESCGACRGAIEAAHDAWKLYEREMQNARVSALQ